MATEAENRVEAMDTQEDSSVELRAPEGWKKKLCAPLQSSGKKGGTPGRKTIVFISPTGEEIKHRKGLEKYLRTHPGSPPLSEFDWGTSDTPRRSARIKSKAIESPEPEPAKKRERKSSSEKGSKEDKEITLTEGEASKVEDAVATDAEGVKVDADLEMKDAEIKDNTAEEVVTGEGLVGETKQQDSENKNVKTVEDTEKSENIGEANNEADADVKEGEVENSSTPAHQENKQSEVPTEEEKVTEEASSEGSKVVEEAPMGADTNPGETKSEDNNQTSLMEKAAEVTSTEGPTFGEEASLKENAAEATSIEGPKFGEEASLKEEDASLKEGVKHDDILADNISQTNHKEDIKVGESLPENSKHTLEEAKLLDDLPENNGTKDCKEDSDPKEYEAQHQPKPSPVHC